MRVLLVVDVQNDFCPGGALGVPEGDQVVPVVNSLMHSGEFDYVIASQDWHPRNHISFASNNPGSELFSQKEIKGIDQTMWPDHCKQGSYGSQFHPDLDREGIDFVIQKGINPEVDSYSAFFDNHKLQETGLTYYLKSIAQVNGIEVSDIELTVCGLATDYCVAATARDAVELGIQTSLVVDACRAVNMVAGDDVRALKELADLGVDIVESREIIPAGDRDVRLQDYQRCSERSM